MYNHNSKSQEREYKGLEPRDVKSIEAVNYSLKTERKKNRDRISYFGPILARSCFGFLVPYLLLMPIVPMMFDAPGSEHNYLAWVVAFLVVIAPIVLITTGIVLRKLNRKWSAQQLENAPCKSTKKALIIAMTIAALYTVVPLVFLMAICITVILSRTVFLG